MPSLTHLAAALALASTALSNPIALENRKAFTIDQVSRTLQHKNGPKQLAKTYRKYGAAVPENVLAASQTVQAAADAGSAPAEPNDEYDSAYLSPVTIGNKTVHLDLDTGSADL